MNAMHEALYCLLMLFPDQCTLHLPAGFDCLQLSCQVFGQNTTDDGFYKGVE